MQENALKVTMITWYDHRGQHGWHDEDETLLEDAKVPMVSVGFVVEEDDHGVVICGTYDTLTGCRDDSTVILKSAIQRRADIPLFEDEDEPYMVVDEDTTFAELYDPPDGTLHTTDTLACGGPLPSST